MRRVDLLAVAVGAFDAGGRQSRCQQRAFDRIGRAAAEKHLLDVVDLWREEVGQRGVGWRHG